MIRLRAFQPKEKGNQSSQSLQIQVFTFHLRRRPRIRKLRGNIHWSRTILSALSTCQDDLMLWSILNCWRSGGCFWRTPINCTEKSSSNFLAQIANCLYWLLKLSLVLIWALILNLLNWTPESFDSGSNKTSKSITLNSCLGCNWLQQT